MALNDYSRRFAARLFEEFPNFRALLVERPDDECFTIEMKSPSGVPLWIRTEAEERLTVGFETIHVHFGGWRESIDEVDFDEAIRFILGIMLDNWVVVVRHIEGASYRDFVPRDHLRLDSDCRFEIKTWSA